jgi:Raf kinase inhibitor-like YbhB/YbcL family protein
MIATRINESYQKRYAMNASMMDKAKGLLGHLLKNFPSSNQNPASSQSDSGVPMSLLSTAFQPMSPIPRKYAAEGDNISPPLNWAGIPWETKELVLVVEDPDAPMPEPVVHWIVYHIPPTAGGLPEAVPAGATIPHPPGARQSMTYNRVQGYTGPNPPLGHGVHHYHFQLFAVDQTLNLDQPTKDDLAQAMKEHVLAHSELVGTYQRVAPK